MEVEKEEEEEKASEAVKAATLQMHVLLLPLLSHRQNPQLTVSQYTKWNRCRKPDV